MTDWKYIHSAADSDERDEITLLLLQRAARRRARLILVKGRFIPERRAPWLAYHLVGDTRRPFTPRWRLFEAPNPANTPRVLANALLGLLVVTWSALVAAAVAPVLLYAIPAYTAFAALVLLRRQKILAT